MTIDEAISEIKSAIDMMVDKTTKRTNDLEKRIKKIEREIKFHWRILDIFLFLNIIAFLHYQILPLIIH